jgi:hypothetical protein
MTSIHSSPGGSPWDESLDLIDHSGAPHMGLSAFMVSFVMLTSWVLLQMCTVVLLDSFTKASLLIEHEEEAASYTKRSTEARPPAPRANPCPTRARCWMGWKPTQLALGRRVCCTGSDCFRRACLVLGKGWRSKCMVGAAETDACKGLSCRCYEYGLGRRTACARSPLISSQAATAWGVGDGVGLGGR